jgi:glutathione synthase
MNKKRLIMIVNDARSLGVGQATTLILARAASLGHTVHVVSCGALHVDELGDVRAQAFDVSAAQQPEHVLATIASGQPHEVVLQSYDLVWVRTNPGRDERAWLHQNVLVLLMLVQAAGVRVINDPVGLQRASSKLYLNAFPEHVRPRTLVSHNPAIVREFIARMDGPCVLKPLRGTHGRDVFKVSGTDADNLNQLLELMTRHDDVIAQEFVPDAVHGDVRILLVDGALFEIDGKCCAVRRRPGGSDFRSNVHAGGSVVRAVLTDVMRETVAQIEPLLVRDGIFFAGLDFIGDKIVEINVFSPGGLGDAQLFEGPDFTSALVERALA